MDRRLDSSRVFTGWVETRLPGMQERGIEAEVNTRSPDGCYVDLFAKNASGEYGLAARLTLWDRGWCNLEIH